MMALNAKFAVLLQLSSWKMNGTAPMSSQLLPVLTEIAKQGTKHMNRIPVRKQTAIELGVSSLTGDHCVTENCNHQVQECTYPLSS